MTPKSSPCSQPLSMLFICTFSASTPAAFTRRLDSETFNQCLTMSRISLNDPSLCRSSFRAEINFAALARSVSVAC